MSKRPPIELTISVHELRDCRSQGFKASGDMMLHILRAAGFRFEPDPRPGRPPKICDPWEREDSPHGMTMTFRQWHAPAQPAPIALPTSGTQARIAARPAD